MSRTLMTPKMQRRLPTGNRTLEGEYYQQRQLEADERGAQRRAANDPNTEHHQRQLAIAADLRAMTRARVMLKWGITRYTIEKLYGEMCVGKFGGL